MARQTIGNQEIYARLRQSLESSGIDQSNIDKIISSKTIENILADQPALGQYFRNVAAAFKGLVDPEYDRKAVVGAVQSPDAFKEFYSKDRDTSQGVSFQDKIEGKYFSTPQLFLDEKILSPKQVEALKQLLSEGSFSSSGDNPNSSGGSQNTGKAYAVPGKAYGSSGKTLTDGGGGGSSQSLPSWSEGRSSGDGSNVDLGRITDQQRDQIMSEVQGTPVAGLFGPLIDRDIRAREIYLNIFDRMNQSRTAREAILTEMNGIDPTTPEGQRQMYALRTKMEGMQLSDKEDQDLIVRLQQAQSAFLDLIKTLKDENYRTSQSIIANVK
jgi:hypothetical protein